ncbi:physarolisin II [Streptomyces puniciscabiei]|uniref:Physarolisin II n=1 Tax=Streptomyces puniciscabiei TaxID=164348 RepID=A0A542UL30_9ACTN|nr:S53 family peptidase [Streptomyces puniciscabiei]TQK99764.1 physarolisin II [Streptomyces puniciscabiei]
MRRTVSLTAVATLATAALALAAPVGQAAASSSHGVSVAHACAAPAKKDQMACNALQVTSGTPASAHAESALTAAAAPSGYGPASLQAAYNLPSASGGSGQTVAIVDAYDDPNAESDLAVYRSQYGLSACTTANGCFKKVDQNGGTKYPRGNSGWAEEISLDLDMVSAACPNCKILLVEASSSSMTNLGTGVNTAVNLGAKFVSNSYGGSESSSDATYDSAYFNHPGVAITVSSGDNGYGVEYPAASKYVTAVGGTSLKTASNTRGWTDTVWSGAGSGCSAYDAKPSWQKDSGCAKRTVADVSAVADPNTGVAVYDTYGQGSGWMVFGGTSASSPLIAATYALAGAPSAGSYPASFPYAHTSSLNDVTSGSNGSCSGSYLCTGTTGYDGPTGLGTPNGTAAFTG